MSEELKSAREFADLIWRLTGTGSDDHGLIYDKWEASIVKAVLSRDKLIEEAARLAFYAEIMSLRCEPLGRLGMVQALKENKAAPSTSSVSGTKEGKEAISIEEAKAITEGYPPSSCPRRSDE